MRILVVFLMVFLFACKQDDDSTVLTTYFQIDPANPQQQGFVDTLKEFEALYPDITFENEYATGEAFHQKFQAMAASRQLPDLFTVYVGKRTAYITETGLVADLRDFMAEGFQEQFLPSTWAKQGANGEIYTIPPSMAITHAFYINTEILNELGLEEPKTYEDLKKQVPIIREAGYYPVSLGNKDQWPLNSWLLSVFVDRLGGKEWLDAARVGDASFTDPVFVDALAYIDDMVKNDVFSPGVNQMSNQEADEEFYQQKSVYLIDAAWRVSAMINTLPVEQQEQIKITVFPELLNEVSVGSSAAVPSEGFGINAQLSPDSVKGKIAWEFIRFYNSKEGAEKRLLKGEVPSFRLTYDDYGLPYLQNELAKFASTVPMGYVIDAQLDAEGMGILNPAIQAMTFGEKTPLEVAQEYEDWVSQNETDRQN